MPQLKYVYCNAKSIWHQINKHWWFLKELLEANRQIFICWFMRFMWPPILYTITLGTFQNSNRIAVIEFHGTFYFLLLTVLPLSKFLFVTYYCLLQYSWHYSSFLLKQEEELLFLQDDSALRICLLRSLLETYSIVEKMDSWWMKNDFLILQIMFLNHTCFFYNSLCP